MKLTRIKRYLQKHKTSEPHLWLVSNWKKHKDEVFCYPLNRLIVDIINRNAKYVVVVQATDSPEELLKITKVEFTCRQKGYKCFKINFENLDEIKQVYNEIHSPY